MMQECRATLAPLGAKDLQDRFRSLEDAYSATYDRYGPDAAETEAAWTAMRVAGRDLKSYYAKMGESRYGRAK